MIQRIQTIFLLIALIMMGLIMFLPLGEIAVNEKIYSFSIFGIMDILNGQTIYRAWHLIGLAGCILALQLIIIFSFKKRIKQISISFINILLMVGFLIVCWLFVSYSAKSLGGGIYSFHLSTVIPIICIFLNYLAIKAIRRDEALVKSIDRIR